MNWSYEMKFFTYQEGKELKQYLPDFYIHDLNLFVEISGIVDPGRKQLKVRAVQKAGNAIVELKESYVSQLPLYEDTRDHFNFATEYQEGAFNEHFPIFHEMFQKRLNV